MNMFSSISSRMSERTKLIAVAVVAFWLGGLLKGGSSIGRYQPCGNSPNYVLDTAKGTVWVLEGIKFKEFGSF